MPWAWRGAARVPQLCPLARRWQAADFLGVRGLLDALLRALSTTLAARTPDEDMAFLGLRCPDVSACSAASARALLEKHAVRRTLRGARAFMGGGQGSSEQWRAAAAHALRPMPPGASHRPTVLSPAP